MTTSKKFVPLVLLATGLFAFAGCSEDDDNEKNENPDFDGYTKVDVDNIVVTDSVDFDVREILEMQIQALQADNSEDNEEELKALKAELNRTDSINKALLDSLKQQDNDFGEAVQGVFGKVFTRKIQYETKSADGSDITLSAVVGFCGYTIDYIVGTANIYYEPDDLLLGCHATIASNSECPSERIKKGFFDLIKSDVGMMLWDGRAHSMQTLTVIPDYEGYGDTKDRAHPYLMQEATARQVVDAGLQALDWFKKYTKKSMEDDWNTVIIGYSQGGSVAMATQRYIEENNLGSDFHLSGAVCGDGPYSPIVTFNRYIKDNKVYMPEAMALIIKGALDYDVRMSDYTTKDFFTDDFVNTGIFDSISAKNLNTTGLENTLKNNGVKCNEEGYWTVDQCLRQEVIDFFSGKKVDGKYKAKLEALYEALDDNDLVDDWEPNHRIILFHGKDDEVVPLDNYLYAALAWKGNPYFCGLKYDKWDVKQHSPIGSEFYMYWDTMLMKRVLGDSEFKSGTWRTDGERGAGGNFVTTVLDALS